MIELRVTNFKKDDKPPAYTEAVKTAKENDGNLI